jgi:hypothetical protein
MTLETIDYDFNGQTLQLIPTEGGHVDNCGKIAGLFESEDDARGSDPDSATWGTVAWDSLTPEQQAVAARNSVALSGE